MHSALTETSQAFAGIVARVAPAVCAVRLETGRHQSGLLWQPGWLLTAEAGLPASAAVLLVRPGGAVVPGRVIVRDAAAGVAAIQLAMPAGAAQWGVAQWGAAPWQPAAGPSPGALVLLVGTTATAEPTARRVMLHAAPASPGARWLLDAPLQPADAGGPVLDAAGGLLGLAVPGPEGLSGVAPWVTLQGLLPASLRAEPEAARGAARGAETAGAEPPPADPGGANRGWLGLALQPVVRSTRLGLFAHRKGRRVVAVEPDGPAALAGIAVGDTLLAIDGVAINGQHTLRQFLGPERVGTTVELRLAHHNRVETRRVTVLARPPER